MTTSNTALANTPPAEGEAASFSPGLRFFAHVVSYVFHPLFITTYVMGFLIFLHPEAFAGFEHKAKVLKFLHILIMTAIFPAFAVFLLWRLKFVESMLLRTEKERIIPYIITMIFYWWSWNVFKHLTDSPPVTVNFLLGSFLAICGAWFANIYFKISMHAVGVGGLIGFVLLYSFQDPFASGLYICIVLLIAGLVCTSRLILSAHNGFQVWMGLFVGILAQIVGFSF